MWPRHALEAFRDVVGAQRRLVEPDLRRHAPVCALMLGRPTLDRRESQTVVVGPRVTHEGGHLSKLGGLRVLAQRIATLDAPPRFGTRLPQVVLRQMGNVEPWEITRMRSENIVGPCGVMGEIV